MAEPLFPVKPPRAMTTRINAALSVDGLRIGLGGRKPPPPVVKDVALTIGQGEILGLVGESGAGKSMIGSALIGLVPKPLQVLSGSITLDGQRFDARSPKALAGLRGRRIGSVFQDPMTSLNPLLTIGQQLQETVRRHRGLKGKAAREAGIDLLSRAGLPGGGARWHDYPHQFSGGMRQRVVIALALAGRPRLIVADEPTTALDVSLQAQITGLLRELADEEGLSVLLITHDMGVIAESADRVAVMRQGRLLEAGPAQTILTRPDHPYTRALLDCIPQPARPRHRLPTVDDSAPEKAPPDGPPPEPRQAALLQIDGLSKSFAERRSLSDLLRGARKARPAVIDVSLALNPGETLGLVGESGSGKSTLARCLAGLIEPDAGSITVAGHDWRDGAVRQRQRGIVQMIFQDPFSSLNPRLRVSDILAEPLKALQPDLTASDRRDRAAELLQRVGLPSDSLTRYPHAFSGGQRQRLAIARALSTTPRLLICDEPTSALDVSVQAQILNLMRDLQDRLGLAMLFITHDLSVVHHMAGEIAVMQQGRIVEYRDKTALFDAPEHPYTRNLLAALPELPSLAA